MLPPPLEGLNPGERLPREGRGGREVLGVVPPPPPLPLAPFFTRAAAKLREPEEDEDEEGAVGGGGAPKAEGLGEVEEKGWGVVVVDAQRGEGVGGFTIPPPLPAPGPPALLLESRAAA